MIKKPIKRKWNKKFGFWQYDCGCIQYQDGFDLCKKHKNHGYISLMRDTK